MWPTVTYCTRPGSHIFSSRSSLKRKDWGESVAAHNELLAHVTHVQVEGRINMSELSDGEEYLFHNDVEVILKDNNK